ncbi:helix-turn-helix domain-containing protein [Sunxiuqinia elliptica]|uniref:Helix-turn-helix n=1 Tax=Sunxiuqinia elliptica TaxID=655355 RepID=A0A1I2GWZ3_9BACT|nr:helix-turn-helix transcriptional regulator [Sunxiuqinia elliptica]SFF21952.1 Helix-turn-helix [Sunxiuqinia elliptica]
MNSRIKNFMDHKGLSSSELADTIGVQRSNVTHVLHGRNKPSFQFISKLLETYPEINAKWLIMGNGTMLEDGSKDQVQPVLFEQQQELQAPVEKERIKPLDISAPTVEKTPVNPLAEAVRETSSEKQVERIVVFYTDQTFREYGPSK